MTLVLLSCNSQHYVWGCLIVPLLGPGVRGVPAEDGSAVCGEPLPQHPQRPAPHG